jgi:hypothetical protein
MNEILNDIIMSQEWDDVCNLYDQGSNNRNEIATAMELLKFKLEEAIKELRK